MKARALVFASLMIAGCGPAPGKWEPAEVPPSVAPPLPGEEEGNSELFDGDDADASAAMPFASYRDKLLDELLRAEPGWGREVGMHEFDGKLPDFSKEGNRAHVARLRKALSTLRGYAASSLDENDALDKAILENEISLKLFFLSDIRTPETDPRFYQELFGISNYIDFEYAPLAQRAQKLVEHEEAALKQVQFVLGNMESKLSKPIVEVSIKVYAGYAEYLRGDVRKLLAGVGDAAFKARFAKANDALADHAASIADRLKKEWLPRADLQSHILGLARYKRFVSAQEGRAIDMGSFKRMAEKDLERNKQAFLELRNQGVTPTRPDATVLLKEATRLMDESRKFVLAKDLVSIPSDDRCTLKETPPFMHWNAAFLNMPGPFDSAKQAFYYITLPDPTWPKREQEEYIFPWGVLQATTVHEVYPGHFLHGLWIRNAPTKVQKMVRSYSFTEGWAHYTEQLMIEQGFRTKTKENTMGQLMDALLRNCRFVASIGIHTEGMTLEQAAKRFVDDCMQDKATAREQAIRGTFDPGYFAYTLGKLQILQLREELQKELGDKFDLKRFHDAVLSHGSPPIALIAERVKRVVRANAK